MTPDQVHSSRRRFLITSLAGLATPAILPSGNALAADSDRFELSIHQYSLRKLFQQGQLDTFAYPKFVHENFGFTSIEFAVEFCQQLYADPAKGRSLADESQKLGIRHRALLCGAKPALDAASRSERKAAVQDHLKWAKVATELRCDFIRVRAGTEGNRQQQLEHAASGIGALCDQLSDAPVSVLVENITGHSRDADWMVALVERVGKDRLGLIADFGNFEGDIYAGMKKLLPYTKSICTKSWEFDAQGNETKIDFQKMMNVINESSFRGCIAIEYLGDDPVAGVQQTATLVKRFMA